tara:strand:- start:54 stop:530 length:477 start_codon:yes stop_codon:yes gene_type:complete
MSVLKVDSIQNTSGVTGLTLHSTGAILKSVIPYGQASKGGSAQTPTNKLTLDSNVLSGGGLTVDQTNHRMIVPIAGFYAIGFTQLTDSTNTNTEVHMRKNGSTIGGSSSQTHAGNSYATLSQHILIDLAVNDYIEWWVAAGAVHNNSQYNTMYVYLLG